MEAGRTGTSPHLLNYGLSEKRGNKQGLFGGGFNKISRKGFMKKHPCLSICVGLILDYSSINHQ
jgi:hypothetical protein